MCPKFRFMDIFLKTLQEAVINNPELFFSDGLELDEARSPSR